MNRYLMAIWSSDHLPVMVTIHNIYNVYKPSPPTLHTKFTACGDSLKEILQNINTRTLLNTQEQIDYAVELLTTSIQQTVWTTTPVINNKHKSEGLPPDIRNFINKKRRFRKIWQTTRQPSDKKRFKTLSRNLKIRLKIKWEETLQLKLSNLTPNIKQPTKPLPPILKPEIHEQEVMKRNQKLLLPT